MLMEPELHIIAHLIASEALLPVQRPAPSQWSAEHRLAGAVLADALLEIREHHGNPARRREIIDDLAWIFSNDVDWPFSFIRLCDLFAVEPDYVRETVRRWMSEDAILPGYGPLGSAAQARQGGPFSDVTAAGARRELVHVGLLPEGIVWQQGPRAARGEGQRRRPPLAG